MSKKNGAPNMKPVKCNKCNQTGLSVPGKQHRRCSGQPDQPIRPKHEGIEPASGRGRWE